MLLLRDIREGTRLLLLHAVTTRRVSRLKGLADQLGISVAGVSEYVKAMEKDGLIRKVGGEYRATQAGVEFLQERFRALRSFVESSSRGMALIDETVAIARDSFREGDTVGLFMENGTLVARRKASPSTGVAARTTRKGAAVRVRNLEGIVALRPGKVTVARMGSRTTSTRARSRLRTVRRDAVAILDAHGRAVADRLGVARLIEFGAIPATVEAAQRGLDVLLLCPEERVAEVVAALEDANLRSEEKIPYETLSL